MSWIRLLWQRVHSSLSRITVQRLSELITDLAVTPVAQSCYVTVQRDWTLDSHIDLGNESSTPEVSRLEVLKWGVGEGMGRDGLSMEVCGRCSHNFFFNLKSKSVHLDRLTIALRSAVNRLKYSRLSPTG